jgi:formimidoylglutamate deiminase
MPESRTLFVERALLPDGWAERVAISIDAYGTIKSVLRDVRSVPEGAETPGGVLVPGVANCHSHAFQRAMLGLTETRGSGEDSFWSWRDAMYRLLENIGPGELQAIAAQLYVEMLKQGYTGVAEFHYLHHDHDGLPYSDPAETSHRVIAAAQAAGIHITHLPVLYCHSDFGALPPEQGQRRFVHSIDAYVELLQGLSARYLEEPDVQLGIAPHSLRAVSEPVLTEAIAALDHLDDRAPIHIHIAEQEREVENSIAHSGARPVEWLLQNFDVSGRWCLVHATHIDDSECAGLAKSGAVAGLCPTTEANLGDGLFPAVDYLAAGGRIAIGSDSQVTLDPAQELRLLEYGQRLSLRRRSLLASESQVSVGEFLLRRSLAGGAQALGINAGDIAEGRRADLVVLDDQHPALYGKAGSTLLDSWVFGCNSTPVKDVMVGGKWRLRDGVHPEAELIEERYRRAMDQLYGDKSA